MKRLVTLACAALAALSFSGLGVSSAEAHGSRYYVGHGQYGSGVLLEVVTTVVIRQQVRVRPVMRHYAYYGHRYAFGSGPLWGAHLHYCTHRYRSYNPHTNLFVAYSGGHHHCRSPHIR